jgi:hypothetical protein
VPGVDQKRRGGGVILIDAQGHIASTDSAEELHAFAARLGLRREWYQGGRHPHYDLTTERARQRALAAGAVLVMPTLLAVWAWWSRREPTAPILVALGRWRMDLGDEAALQGQIAHALKAAGLPFTREAQLSPRDRIDFMVGPVGMEVKIKGGPAEIKRQCARYCETGRIGALILATRRRIGLPAEIAGVPCLELNLSEAWM